MTDLRQRMIDDLQLAGLSQRTQQAYVRAVRQLAEHYRKSPDQLTEQQLRNYFLYLKNHKKFAPASLRIAYSGIKFFFTRTLNRDWSTLKLLRAEHQRRLPDVLTRDEVHALLNAVRTPHNRACLWTIYSCGLRLSEGVSLQVSDVDSARRMIHVHRGKGAKDRYVPLPQTTLQVLRAYWKTHRNPTWLFPALGRDRKQGATATRPMPIDTVQGAFRQVVKQLGLRKRVSVHTLRHSYATHLLESGVNVRLIQQYLGHAFLNSVMVYLHLTHTGQQEAYGLINTLMANRKEVHHDDAR